MTNLSKFLLTCAISLVLSPVYADDVNCTSLPGSQWKLHFVAADTGIAYDFNFGINQVSPNRDPNDYFEMDITSTGTQTPEGPLSLAADVPSNELCTPYVPGSVTLQLTWASPAQAILQLTPLSINVTPGTQNMLNTQDAHFTYKQDTMGAGAGSYLERL